MAGHHFNDPRVFYDMTADQKYASLDDLFNPGKKEPKFIESEYRIKDGKQGGKNNPNQKKNNNEDGEAQQKKDAKSKIQTVELNVKLCCDSCTRKVVEVLEDLEGIENVDCDQGVNKVWVKGSVKPEIVLRKVKRVQNEAELVVKKK